MMCSVQVLLLPDVMRREASAPRNVCRRLFAADGEGSESERRTRFLTAVQRDLEQRDCERWNFDFRAGTPLPGRYQWAPLATDGERSSCPRRTHKTTTQSKITGEWGFAFFPHTEWIFLFFMHSEMQHMFWQFFSFTAIKECFHDVFRASLLTTVKLKTHATRKRILCLQIIKWHFLSFFFQISYYIIVNYFNSNIENLQCLHSTFRTFDCFQAFKTRLNHNAFQYKNTHTHTKKK